ILCKNSWLRQRRIDPMMLALWTVKRAAAIVALIAVSLAAVPLASTIARAAGPVTNSDEDAKPGTSAYRLDTGDKVKVIVYGEDDLSGEFDVDGSGFVRLPLIGQVRAAGLTLKEFEAAVEAKLSAGYLV